MYCKKCGCEVNQDQKFCSKCGEVILENQVSGKKPGFAGNMRLIVAGVCIILIVFVAIKLLVKSDAERITGTWVLVEELYGGRQESDDIGAQLIFEEKGLLYDEEDVLREQFSSEYNSGSIISWNIADENKNYLIFTNDWEVQFRAEYEFKGKKLKISESQDTYTVWEKR